MNLWNIFVRKGGKMFRELIYIHLVFGHPHILKRTLKSRYHAAILGKMAGKHNVYQKNIHEINLKCKIKKKRSIIKNIVLIKIVERK